MKVYQTYAKTQKIEDTVLDNAFITIQTHGAKYDIQIQDDGSLLISKSAGLDTRIELRPMCSNQFTFK